MVSHAARVRGAARLDHDLGWQMTLMVPPAKRPGLVQVVYSLLSAATRQKTQLVENLDQALTQLYGRLEIQTEVSIEQLSKPDLQHKVRQLQRRIDQDQQEADQLAKQLSQILWSIEEAGSIENLDWAADSALGDLAAVIEVVQLDLQQLLSEREQRR